MSPRKRVLSALLSCGRYSSVTAVFRFIADLDLSDSTPGTSVKVEGVKKKSPTAYLRASHLTLFT